MKRSRLLVGAVATGLAATVIPAPAYACDEVCEQPNSPGVQHSEEILDGLIGSAQFSSNVLKLNEAIPVLSSGGSSAASAPVVAPSAPAVGSIEAGLRSAAGSAEVGVGSAAGSAEVGIGSAEAALGSSAGSAAASAGTSAVMSDPGLGSAAGSLIPDMSLTAGVPFSYQIPLSAGSVAPAALSGLPIGLSYDPYTGLISGVPLSGASRICDVGVIGSGGSHLGSFSMSLSDPAIGSSIGSSELSGAALGSGAELGSSGALGSAGALGSGGGLGSATGSAGASSAAFGGLLSSVAALAIGAGVLGALSAGSSASGGGEDAPVAPDKPAENAPGGQGGGKGIPKDQGMGGGAPQDQNQAQDQPGGKGGGAPKAAAAPQQLANTGADGINVFLLSLVAFAAGGSLLLAQRKRR